MVRKKLRESSCDAHIKSARLFSQPISRLERNGSIRRVVNDNYSSYAHLPIKRIRAS